LGKPFSPGLKRAPAVAAVGRAPQAAAGAAAGQAPRGASRLPGAGPDDARVVRIDADIAGAGVGVDLQHALPTRAAVLGAIHAAFATRLEWRAENRREGHSGVIRIDRDLPDRGPQLQRVLPGLAGIGRHEQAGARLHIAADVGFAAADVDDVRIRRRHRERADRIARHAIEDGLPCVAAVNALPHAALCRGQVPGQRIAGDTGNLGDAPADGRAE
jgi:hypothetical protein